MLITNEDVAEAVVLLRRWRDEGREHFRSYIQADSLFCESCEPDGGPTTYVIPREEELGRIDVSGPPLAAAELAGLPAAVVAVAAAVADDHPARVTGPLKASAVPKPF